MLIGTHLIVQWSVKSANAGVKLHDAAYADLTVGPLISSIWLKMLMF